MIGWEKIKESIFRETNELFKGDVNFKPYEIIELFERIVRFKLNDSKLKLDGLETRLPHSLEKILVEGQPKDDNISYFTDFARIEPYLRKILYLVNPTKFTDLNAKRSGLATFIKELKINSNNIDFNKVVSKDVVGLPDYGEHLYRVYHLRNVESHQCANWTSRELYQNIESVLVIYLFVTYQYYEDLKKLVRNYSESQHDFAEYLNEVKSNFKSRIGRFIHINTQENLKISQGFVVENIADLDNERVERKGTVNDLRNFKVPEKRMIIWGDAGMGKSTTLEYLAYIDAEERLKNNYVNIPVYISLGLLTDKSISLKKTIFDKLGVSDDIGDMMLKDGQLNLFLDGLNEIPRDDNNHLKTLRQKEIQNLINDYQETFIILSNRPQTENAFKNIPVFQLQKMNREQVEQFVLTNTDGNEKLKESILKAILKDERLGKIIKTPLMLSRLIEIIKVKGEIPKSEGEIIDKFIHSLYIRELQEKKDANFNIKVIHRLLRYLGYESLENKDTNSGMQEDEVLNYFIECKNKYGFVIDTIYVLEVSTQLGILEKRDEMYTFAHQAYQDYYHSQEEKAMEAI